MKEFQCTGAECPDTCCKNWSINIDRKTYEKYQKMGDTEIGGIIGNFVERLPENEANDGIYARINLRRDRFCPFLDSEKWCVIHRDFGSDYLSNACAMYPRVLNYVNGGIEQCGDVSCPVLADLALANPEGIDFIEEDAEIDRADRNLYFTVVDLPSAGLNVEMENFAADLRTRSFELILDDRFTLEQSLLLLGQLYSQLQEKMVDGSAKDFNEMMDKHRQSTTDGPADTEPDMATQLGMLQPLMEALREGAEYQHYEDFYTRCRSGLGLEDNDTDTERYEAAFKEVYRPAVMPLAYILENYIVNDMFRSLMPLPGMAEGDLMTDYIKMVLRFALIRLHLAGIAGHEGGLTIKSVLEIIQVVTRSLETNSVYAERVAELLSEYGTGDPVFSVIILTT